MKVLNITKLINNQTYEVTLTRTLMDKVEVTGLPIALQELLINYKDEEIWEDTVEVFKIIMTMHAALQDAHDVDTRQTMISQSISHSNIGHVAETFLMRSQSAIREHLQPPNMETFENELVNLANVQRIDPSSSYEISSKVKLGAGGFAKVFKVRRSSDGLVCALKFCEPRNKDEKNLIINEVGLMNQIKGEETVLEVFDTYEYRDRLWIFLELMDYSMTPIIDRFKTEYNEGVIKYVLLKTLQGLALLHNKFIIHRDIKSDNILVDVKANIKLADFGYAAQ